MLRPEIHRPLPDSARRKTASTYLVIPENPRDPVADFWRYFIVSAAVGIAPFVILFLAALLLLFPFAGPILATAGSALAGLAFIVLIPIQFVIVNHAFNNMVFRSRHRLVVTLSCLFFVVGPFATVIWGLSLD